MIKMNFKKIVITLVTVDVNTTIDQLAYILARPVLFSIWDWLYLTLFPTPLKPLHHNFKHQCH